MRRWPAALVATLVLIGVMGGAWAVTRGDDARDPIVAAVSAAPQGSRSVSITAWSRLPESLDKASLQDLTSVSIIAEYADQLQSRFGWKLTDLDWEASISTPDGQVLVLGLGDLDAKTAKKPWADDAFAATFGKAEVHQGVLVASPSDQALDAVMSTLHGRSPSLMTVRGVTSLTHAMTGRAAAELRSGTLVCDPDRDSGLDDDEIEALRRVEERHGSLTDPAWTMRALGTDPRRYVFGAVFDSPDVARGQLDVRTALTTGSFLGRYGKVEDSLTDLHAQVDGGAVIFDFEPTAEAEHYMVGSGPIVFSGCAVAGRN